MCHICKLLGYMCGSVSYFSMWVSLLVQLRLASTADCGDGVTFLALNSSHYLNIFADSGWRNSIETREEFRQHQVLR